MKHANKIAIVTGGSEGIGFVIGQKLSDEGATVVIASRNEVKGVAAQKKIYRSWFVSTDVTIEESIVSLVNKVIERYGKIDVVVNNAGMDLPHANVTEISQEFYGSVMDTNFKSIVMMTKHTIPYLVNSKGNIVNIASQLGINADKEVPLYCAAKAAAIMFTKSMALAYGKDGVRINAVCPGAVNTALLQSFFDNERELLEWYSDPKIVPIGRVGEAIEIANVVNFISSDEAAYVHGAAWLVDGGSSV